jgi:hypothetical protein
VIGFSDFIRTLLGRAAPQPTPWNSGRLQPAIVQLQMHTSSAPLIF